MTKQQIYENILASQSGMDYIPGIRFEESIINIDKANALNNINQLETHTGKKRCRCGSIEYSWITTRDCPVGLAYYRAIFLPWRWDYINLRQIRQENYQKWRKREIV